MADTDVLPYDYPAYAHEVKAYIEAAKRKAADAGLSGLDFAPALERSRKVRQGGGPCAPIAAAPPS